MITSLYSNTAAGPYLRGRLGGLQFRDRRVAAGPAGSAAAPLATYAAFRFRSGGFIQSHQRRDIRYRDLSVVDAGRTPDFLSA